MKDGDRKGQKMSTNYITRQPVLVSISSEFKNYGNKMLKDIM